MNRVQRKKDRKLKRSNLIFFAMICISISTIFTFNLTNSRYSGEISAEEDILAIPVINLNNNVLTCTLDDMIPGDTKDYTFTVSNFTDTQSNEIPLSYYFKLTNSSEVPLTFKMYQIDGGTQRELTMVNNQTEAIDISSVASDTDKAVHTFKVEVIWDAANNDASYAGKSINLNILLEAVQVVS